MGWWADFLKRLTWAGLLKFLLLDFLPSFGDLGTDILNSLDMLGYNFTHDIESTVYSVITDTTNSTSTYVYREDPIWGVVGLLLVFLPGIPVAISVIAINWNAAVCWGVACLAGFCYPLTMCIGQLSGFFSGDSDVILAAVAGEAFFESSPQLVLQMFTILYGYPTGPLQITTISLSFLLLSKTAILFDLVPHGLTFDPLSSNHWAYLLTVTPLYTTSIIFRVGSLAVITAYLRYISIIPIIARVLIYAALAKKYDYGTEFLPIAIVANMGSFTRGVPDTDNGMDVKQSFLFLVSSTIATFCLESMTLVAILIMAEVNPTYFTHWLEQLHYFHNTSNIVMGLILVGIVNLSLLYFTRGKLENPNLPEKKKEEDDLEME